MVGNFHFPSGKALFGAAVDDGEPLIVTSNKMANNVWEVNEKCSVSKLIYFYGMQ